MAKKKEKNDLSPEERIAGLEAQIKFLQGLIQERNAQLSQALETIKAQNKTIELLNSSLDAMNKTNELLRKK